MSKKKKQKENGKKDIRDQLLRLLESADKKNLLKDFAAVNYTDPKCKICNSDYKNQITADLLKGVTYRDIIKNYKPMLGLNLPNLSTHYNNHVEAPLIKEIMKLFNENKLQFVDAYKQLYEGFELWDDTVESLQNAIANSDDIETIHTKISVLNQLIRTKLKMIEMLGKFQGINTTSKKPNKNNVDNILAEVRQDIAKSSGKI